MPSADHAIDLPALSRGQLKQLQTDVAQELAAREDADRDALEEKLRLLVEQAGFDGATLHIGIPKKRGRPKGSKNGKADAVQA